MIHFSLFTEDNNVDKDSFTRRIYDRILPRNHVNKPGIGSHPKTL